MDVLVPIKLPKVLRVSTPIHNGSNTFRDDSARTGGRRPRWGAVALSETPPLYEEPSRLLGLLTLRLCLRLVGLARIAEGSGRERVGHGVGYPAWRPPAVPPLGLLDHVRPAQYVIHGATRGVGRRKRARRGGPKLLTGPRVAELSRNPPRPSGRP